VTVLDVRGADVRMVGLKGVEPHAVVAEIEVTRGPDYWDHGSLKEGRATHVRVAYWDVHLEPHVRHCHVWWPYSDTPDLEWSGDEPPAEVVAAVEGRL
jgi:hypothetical protein